MSIDQTISLVASIGACLSAIAALFIVYQNHRHNKKSSKPILLVLGSHYKFSKSSENEPYPSELVLVDEDDNEKHAQNKNLRSKLELINIGLGTAKKITIKWKWELKNCVNNLKSIISESSDFPGELILKTNSLEYQSKDFSWATTLPKKKDY